MKTPTQAEIKKFMQQWTEACMRFDVRTIEAMLKPKYLNLWWHVWHMYDPSQPFAQTCRGAVGTILQGMHLITDATVRVVQHGVAGAQKPIKPAVATVKNSYRLSPAGRAKIVAAANARWAAYRKAKAAAAKASKKPAAKKPVAKKPAAAKKPATPETPAPAPEVQPTAGVRPLPPTIKA